MSGRIWETRKTTTPEQKRCLKNKQARIVTPTRLITRWRIPDGPFFKNSAIKNLSTIHYKVQPCVAFRRSSSVSLSEQVQQPLSESKLLEQKMAKTVANILKPCDASSHDLSRCCFVKVLQHSWNACLHRMICIQIKRLAPASQYWVDNVILTNAQLLLFVLLSKSFAPSTNAVSELSVAGNPGKPSFGFSFAFGLQRNWEPWGPTRLRGRTRDACEGSYIARRPTHSIKHFHHIALNSYSVAVRGTTAGIVTDSPHLASCRTCLNLTKLIWGSWLSRSPSSH